MKKILIIYPSWEERSSKGFLKDMQYSFTEVLLIRNSSNHSESFYEQLSQIENACKKESIAINYVDICNDSIRNWQELNKEVGTKVDINDDIILDITTMSRNIVWTILYVLRTKVQKVDIVYHMPQTYAKDWISREPNQPRLLLKHSGIYDLGKETSLILITGFDAERTKYMLYKYEPHKVHLLVQEGSQFENPNRNNVETHLRICKEFGLKEEDVISNHINAYSDDLGYNAIDNAINAEIDSNIILASFGPKPSAVAAYRCYMQHPEIALCYLPCNEYNPKYCKGIGDSVSYTLHFPSENA